MLPTTKPTFRFASLLASCALVVLGAGCNGFKAGEPAVDVKAKFAAWVDTQTPVTMSDFYRKALNNLADIKPSDESWAQVSFTKPLPAERLMAIINGIPDLYVVELYARYGTIGLSDLVVDSQRGPALADTLVKGYARNVQGIERIIVEDQKSCAKKSKLCFSGDVEKDQKELDFENAAGQLYLYAIGLKGPNTALKTLWNTVPEIFTIQVENGPYIYGQPLLPTTDMKAWR